MDPNNTEVEEVVETVQETVSNRDDIANDVRAAVESLKAEAAPPAEVAAEPEIEQPAKGDHPSDPLRFSDGTFKPTKTDAAPVKAAAPDPKSPPVDDTAKASTPPSTATGAPPVSWAADAKQAWASLPPAIHAAVSKREAEASAGIVQKSNEIRQYQSLLAPVAQAASQRGMTAEDGLKSLLAAQEFLDRDPRAAIAWLARQSNVDLAQLVENPPAAQQPVRTDPIASQLTQHVSTLEERINSMMTQQNLGVVETFAGSHPHYASVENDLPDIIRELQSVNPSLSGLPLLQAAYDRAIYLNEGVREQIYAEKYQSKQQTQVAQVQQKAVQANKAAVSVKGSSAESRAPKRTETNGTVFDDVRASINQLRAG